MTAVAIQYRDEIIAQVAQGKRLTDIIRDLKLNVSAPAISQVLTSDKEYAAALHVGTVARLDKAEKEIYEAADQLNVSRASAYHRAISWRAEREVPDRYGVKGPNITINALVTVDSGLGSQAGELLDKLRQVNAIDGAAQHQIDQSEK